MAHEIARSWDGRTSRRLRKKIEMLFAHLKRILKLDRLRSRGPNGARDEFTLAATAQNLRKMAKLIATPNASPALRPPRSHPGPDITTEYCRPFSTESANTGMINFALQVLLPLCPAPLAKRAGNLSSLRKARSLQPLIQALALR